MVAPEVRFGALCLVLTWVPWTILGLLGADVNAGVGALVFAAAASGPSLAALVMWLLYPARRRGRTVRLSAVWPVAAVVLGALPAVVSAVVLGGPAAIPPHVAAVAASVGGPLGVVGYTLLVGPLSEEFGWRGFLQPRLRERYGRIRTTAVLAVAWGLWHVPLFLLPGTGQYAKGLLTVRGGLFFVILFPLCFTILYVSEHLRGGVWSAVLVHAAWNGSTALPPEYGDAGAWWQTGVALGIAVVLAVLWRTARPRRSPMASGAGCPQAGFST
jgi:uncharacterized protein